MAKRPAVMRLFHKNAHNYQKDYSVEVHTLGRQIVEWWDELCPPGKTPSVRFGGPTGVYSLIVLMSWWCTLLKTRPDNERTDCLCMLTDIDRVLLTTIGNIRSHVTTSASMLSSPCPSQPLKRANSRETTLPQKRKRPGRV